MKKHKGRTRMLASAGIAVALILGVTAVTDAKPKGKRDFDRKDRPGWRAEKWDRDAPSYYGAPCPLGRYGGRGPGRGPGRGMRSGRGRGAGRGMRGRRGRGPGRGMRGGRGRGVGRGPGCMAPCPLGGPGLGMGGRLGMGPGRGLGAGARPGRLGMAPGVDVDVKAIDDGAKLIITAENEEVADKIRERLHRMVEMREGGWDPRAARRKAFREMMEKREEILEERREARKDRNWDERKKPERRKEAREKREKKEKYERAEKREQI
ncbi:MAG: hypothetical protein V5A84_02165, partial [Planctomycetota bacterium]